MAGGPWFDVERATRTFGMIAAPAQHTPSCCGSPANPAPLSVRTAAERRGHAAERREHPGALLRAQ
jgi:hypothetical protein